MPIIVLEGPDHSGKTTLAEELQARIGAVFNEVPLERSPVKEHGWSDAYNTYLRDRTHLLQDLIGVQDRVPEISETVYGIMRGKPRGRGWCYELYSWLEQPIFFVFCQNSDHYLRGRHFDVEGNPIKDEGLEKSRLLYDQVYFNLRQIVIHAHPHAMRVHRFDFRESGSKPHILRAIEEWLIWQWPEKHRELSLVMEPKYGPV